MTCSRGVAPSISLKAANIREGRHVYLHDLLKLDSYRRPLAAPVFPSPVRLENWATAFNSHPDKHFAAYIHAGLSQGFRIGFDRDSVALRSPARNHPSASANRALVSEYIQAEVRLGRLVGPLPACMVPQLKIRPYSQTPPSRLIVDLSYP